MFLLFFNWVEKGNAVFLVISSFLNLFSVNPYPPPPSCKMQGVWIIQPFRNSSLALYFSLQFLAFRTLSPTQFGISRDLPRGAYGYFLKSETNDPRSTIANFEKDLPFHLNFCNSSVSCKKEKDAQINTLVWTVWPGILSEYNLHWINYSVTMAWH